MATLRFFLAPPTASSFSSLSCFPCIRRVPLMLERAFFGEEMPGENWRERKLHEAPGESRPGPTTNLFFMSLNKTRLTYLWLLPLNFGESPPRARPVPSILPLSSFSVFLLPYFYFPPPERRIYNVSLLFYSSDFFSSYRSLVAERSLLNPKGFLLWWPKNSANLRELFAYSFLLQLYFLFLTLSYLTGFLSPSLSIYISRPLWLLYITLLYL